MTGRIPGLVFLATVIISGMPELVSSRDGMKAAIPDTLLLCYKQGNLQIKDNLLPMSMPVLIDLIRKVESYQGINMDMRTLTTMLLLRFRLDGIERNPDVQQMEYVIPYSPSGSEFYRNKFLMDNLIPSPNYLFPNESLNMIEQCTLHQMLSTSVDRWLRGDESNTCGKLSNLVTWNSRVPRDVNPQRGQDPDAEVFAPSATRNEMSRKPSGGYQQYQSSYSMDYSVSSCPVENGVVFTRYGSVKPGIVLAGIAAGLQPQSISPQNLVRSMTRTISGQTIPPSVYNNFDVNYMINNKWAATLSGEIAEVVLLQGPTYVSSMRVGVTGGWNNTLVPKYYFLNEQSKDALTETDIRGAIDGLLLGNNIIELNRLASGSLKLSQLLEMYYSERGVFDGNFKGCTRKEKFQQVAPTNTLQQESESFAQVFQFELPSAVNMKLPAIQEFTRIAINKLVSYASSMQEPQCASQTSQIRGPIATPAVDLYVVIDATWDFRDISGILSYLVQEVDVNPYGSRVTLVNGKDGSILINTTQHIVEFYQNFNLTYYNMYNRGFDMALTLQQLQMRFEIEMNVQRQSGSSYRQGSSAYYSSNSYGNSYDSSYSSYYSQQQRDPNYNNQNVSPSKLSKVVLFVPTATAGSGDGNSNYILNKVWYFRQNLPDVTLLFFVSGSKDRYSSYALNPNKDILILTMGDIASSINPVVLRIAEVPRPIINPTCGSSWIGRWYSNEQTTGYLQPNSIHYYRVHPNYFYKSSEARIRVQSQGSNSLSVCYSRRNPLPNANNTRGSSDVTCRQITSDTFELRIPDEVCSDVYAFECQPYFISVAFTQAQTSSNCRETECRYPDMVKYSISHDGLTCYSCVIKNIASPLLIVIVLIFTRLHF